MLTNRSQKAECLSFTLYPAGFTVLKFLSVVHKCTKTRLKRTQTPLLLQVLDPEQEQDEESAVVVMEESKKKMKSAQDMVIDVLLPVTSAVQTFPVSKA